MKDEARGKRDVLGTIDEGRRTMDERTAPKRINSVRELDVYRKAFEAAMEIYYIL